VNHVLSLVILWDLGNLMLWTLGSCLVVTSDSNQPKQRLNRATIVDPSPRASKARLSARHRRPQHLRISSTLALLFYATTPASSLFCSIHSSRTALGFAIVTGRSMWVDFYYEIVTSILCRAKILLPCLHYYWFLENTSTVQQISDCCIIFPLSLFFLLITTPNRASRTADGFFSA